MIQDTTRFINANTTQRCCCVAICLIFFSALAIPAFGADLGFFESRRINRQAGEALASGNAEQAVKLFRQLVDGLDRSAKYRVKALYGAALASLALESSDRAAAREHLAELLEVFPGHERSADARAIHSLLEVEESAPEAPPVPAEPEPVESTADKDADEARIGKLESKVARLQAELRDAKEELMKKEEAIEKLKELVVGNGA